MVLQGLLYAVDDGHWPLGNKGMMQSQTLGDLECESYHGYTSSAAGHGRRCASPLGTAVEPIGNKVGPLAPRSQTI